MADLKAYYESEIQILRDKLKLRDLPQDLEKSNQALAERFAFYFLYLFVFCLHFSLPDKPNRTSVTSN